MNKKQYYTHENNEFKLYCFILISLDKSLFDILILDICFTIKIQKKKDFEKKIKWFPFIS